MTPNRVVIVKSDSCPGCEDFLRQFHNDGIKKTIKDATGVDKIEILDLDKDSLAVDIIASLNKYEVPLLAAIKENNGRSEVCEIGEDLKLKSCVVLKSLPPA